MSIVGHVRALIMASAVVGLAGCAQQCGSKPNPQAQENTAAQSAPSAKPDAGQAVEAVKPKAKAQRPGEAPKAPKADPVVQTRQRLERLGDTIDAVSKAKGALPKDLYELVENKPFLQQTALRDRWGNDILYTLSKDGSGYSLRSVGADSAWGGGDDIEVERRAP